MKIEVTSISTERFSLFLLDFFTYNYILYYLSDNIYVTFEIMFDELEAISLLHLVYVNRRCIYTFCKKIKILAVFSKRFFKLQV